jgi:hypothetical protein
LENFRVGNTGIDEIYTSEGLQARHGKRAGQTEHTHIIAMHNKKERAKQQVKETD